MANAVTKRDVLTKAQGLDVWTDEEREVIAKMIGQLDKNSSKPTKAQVENEGIKEQIKAVLGAEGKSAKDIADEVGHSTAKVAALLKQIEGVVKTEGKGKNPTTYTLAE